MSSLFGLDQSNRLVFVSRTSRLGMPMPLCRVQRAVDRPTGRRFRHHFAHASGRGPCDVGHGRCYIAMPTRSSRRLEGWRCLSTLRWPSIWDWMVS